jgi:hypothetical protein
MMRLNCGDACTVMSILISAFEKNVKSSEIRNEILSKYLFEVYEGDRSLALNRLRKDSVDQYHLFYRSES